MNVTIPVSIEGPYYFIVMTDRYNHVFEHIFEGNNEQVRRDEFAQPKPTNVTLTPPDLEVYYVDAPLNAEASHSLTFSYEVVNYGVAATPNSYWTDAYYLSTNTTLEPGTDLSLGSLTHYGALQVLGSANDSYVRTVTYTLSNGLQGDFFVLVQTDSGNAVFEGRAGDLGENNNVTASDGPVHIVSNPPDLIVMPETFVAWGTAAAGSFLRATWGVQNQGTGATVGGTWKCKVYASLDDSRGGPDDRLLATFTHNGDLGPGAYYASTDVQVDIPIDLSGVIYLWVRADADNQVYEGANENNNDSGLVPVTVVQNLADLQVTSVGWTAGVLTAGDTITVTWTVQNAGTGRTNVLSWRDRVYLSPDAVLGNGNDIDLGSMTHGGPLDAGGTRTLTATVRIPTWAAGEYYLGVYADADGQVFEGALEGNNARVRSLAANPVDPGGPVDPSDPGTIDPPPAGVVVVPELVPVSVDAPTEAYSGQAFSLSWTVRNDGDSVTGYWYDQAYLSLDQIYDVNTDVSLGYVWHGGGLANGATYDVTANFNVPRGLAGPFYVFVVVDRGNYKSESNELNNVNYDRTSMLVSLVPPADLVVGTITVPANASPGFATTMTYSVMNQGDDAALGSWYDSIYISSDDLWDVGDALFGRVFHNGNVNGHSSYSHTLEAPLPGVLPADYYVIVRSDIRNHIPESDETNNIGASLDQVVIDAQLLELDIPQTSTLAQGQSVFYKTVELAAGETVRLTFDGAQDAFSELYVRRGGMPSRNQFDLAANQPFVSDQQITLPVQETGVYYILAYGTVASGAPVYTIGAQIIPFSIESVEAQQVGNTGDATVKIAGARFTASTEFYLVDAQLNVLVAERVYVQDSATVFATFDLFQTSPGTYSVGAAEPGTGAAVLLPDSLTIVEGAGSNIDTRGEGPATVRADRNCRFEVYFGNAGDADAMAPLLLVTSPINTPVGLSRGELYSGAPLQILGTPEEGPLDILRPGALNTVSIYFRSGSAAQGVNIRVVPMTHDDSTVITLAEWEQIKLSVKPASVSLDAWNTFWANIPSRIGPTWGRYVQFLNRLAVELSAPGEPVRDVRAMFAQIYATNPGFLPSLTASGQVLDAQSGVPLSGVMLAAYEVVDGLSCQVASTTTGADGTFELLYLPPGTYELALSGNLGFDQNRDGRADDLPPSLVVAEAADTEGLALYAQELQPAEFPTSLSQPALAVDSAGVTHIVYRNGNAIWHAYYDGSGWVGAKIIADEPGTGLTLDAAANLVAGSAPGVVATWSCGTGNEAEIHFAVGRLAAAMSGATLCR